MAILVNYDNSAIGWNRRIVVVGIYVIDVSKCTKNINTSKDNLGKYDIIMAAMQIAEEYGSGTRPAKRISIVLSLLKNLNVLTLNITSMDYDDLTYINYFVNNYGCSTDDIQVLSIDQFNEFLYSNLIRKVEYPVYENVTKINYTNGLYDIVRDVFDESQAKSYAYNQLLNTYGTFYKANEAEISEYYKR